MTEWFRRQSNNIKTINKKDIAEGQWIKCPKCNTVLSRNILKEKRYCCNSCNFHFRVIPNDYIKYILEKENQEELWANMRSCDPLSFEADVSYKKQLEDNIKKTDDNEAVKVISGYVKDIKILLVTMNFLFIGGSMGSVVGEKISRAIDKANKEKLPVLIVCSSGGARMQEGAYSLMQLAKICSKLAYFSHNGNLLITLLTDPTMGGTTASFAMLGDVILSEPGALIGFAGQRVIEQTIGEELPEGFQRAEFLLEKGFIDNIVSRNELKKTIYNLIHFFISKDSQEVEFIE